MPIRSLDVLLVIDNSASMTQRQTAVSRDIPKLAAGLLESGISALRIGATTTSVYENFWDGQTTTFHEFDAPGLLARVGKQLPDGGWDRFDGQQVITGDDLSLADSLSHLVQQGARGSGQVTPLEAARLALVEHRAVNLLGREAEDPVLVVVITNRDDCSEIRRPVQVLMGSDPAHDYCADQRELLTPVYEYYQALHLVSPQLFWATLGPFETSGAQSPDGGTSLDPDCAAAGGGARLDEMQRLLNSSDAMRASICEPSYAQAFDAMAKEVAQSLRIGNRVAIPPVPDERMLELDVTRYNGVVDRCTLANGGIRSYERHDSTATVVLGEHCRRSASDRWLQAVSYCLD